MPEGDIERVTLVAGTPAYPPGDAAVAARMAAAAEAAKAVEASRNLEKSIGNVAAAAVAQTPGLVEGTVANSLAAVMSLAESQNSNMGIALRDVLEAIAEHSQAAVPAPEATGSLPEPESHPAQMINPPDTIMGGA